MTSFQFARLRHLVFTLLLAALLAGCAAGGGGGGGSGTADGDGSGSSGGGSGDGGGSGSSEAGDDSSDDEDTLVTLPWDDVFEDACLPDFDTPTDDLYTFSEFYDDTGDEAESGAAGYSPDLEDCWLTVQSTFTDGNITTGFAEVALTSGTQFGRTHQIDFVEGMETNAGVDFSPFDAPNLEFVDDPGQWPFVADLLAQPECQANVTVSALSQPTNNNTDAQIYGLVLNASAIEGVGDVPYMVSGYLLHINGGGGHATLVKLTSSNEHAFEYLDQFPGMVNPSVCGGTGCPNPTVDGPYKGWDLHQAAFAAGGNPGGNRENVLAAQYLWDAEAETATLRWELRGADGEDDSAEAWDYERVLTGEDALAPTGVFGIYTTFYGAAGEGGKLTSADVASHTMGWGEYEQRCDVASE